MRDEQKPVRDEASEGDIELVDVIAEASDGQSVWYRRLTCLARDYDRFDFIRENNTRLAVDSLRAEVGPGLDIKVHAVRRSVPREEQ